MSRQTERQSQCHSDSDIWQFRKSQIWDSKIWSRVPKDSDPRKTTLARASSIYKGQTRPLVREGALQKQDRNCQRVINIWSWAPDGARHQDLLIDWPSVVMWLWLDLRESLETAVRRRRGWCEMVASLGVSQLEIWVSCGTVAGQ
jgi:hypothetical protein